jgi:hypothetical protein
MVDEPVTRGNANEIFSGGGRRCAGAGRADTRAALAAVRRAGVTRAAPTARGPARRAGAFGGRVGQSTRSGPQGRRIRRTGRAVHAVRPAGPARPAGGRRRAALAACRLGGTADHRSTTRHIPAAAASSEAARKLTLHRFRTHSAIHNGTKRAPKGTFPVPSQQEGLMRPEGRPPLGLVRVKALGAIGEDGGEESAAAAEAVAARRRREAVRRGGWWLLVGGRGGWWVLVRDAEAVAASRRRGGVWRP